MVVLDRGQPPPERGGRGGAGGGDAAMVAASAGNAWWLVAAHQSVNNAQSAAYPVRVLAASGRPVTADRAGALTSRSG